MRQFIYQKFFSLSLYLSNSYAFYYIVDLFIPPQLKLIRLFDFKINIFIFAASLAYAKLVGTVAEIGLGKELKNKEDNEYLSYSLGKFFISTFINYLMVFTLIIVNYFLKLGYNISFDFPSLSLVVFPFLLYAGFFFNLTTSFFVFASKEDYVKNNPGIKPFTIKFIRAVNFFLFLLSFLPFVFISFYYFNSFLTKG